MIRLLGRIIVVDFIDMEEKKSPEGHGRPQLQKDRSPSKVISVSSSAS